MGAGFVASREKRPVGRVVGLASTRRSLEAAPDEAVVLERATPARIRSRGIEGTDGSTRETMADGSTAGADHSPAVRPAVRGRAVRWLVGYVALWQAIHVVVNVRALLRIDATGGTFPAPPPGGGWADSTLAVFVGMGALDAVAALLTLAFAIAYVRDGPSWPLLGTVALTVANYSAILFVFPTWVAGAWTAHPVVYWGLYASFVPIWALTALFAWWGYRGVLYGRG